MDCDGWQIIYEWLKDAIDKDNQSFLIELIKVLRRCPITLERLKQNDTAKLLKDLTKSENSELVGLSKELRMKWKREMFPGESSSEKPKRKLKDASNSNRDGEQLSNGGSGQKKLKTKDENVSLNSLNNDQKKADKTTPSSEKNIKTVKCKLGKSRSIGVLEKSAAKPATSSNSTPTDHKPGTVLLKGAMLFNNTASTPSPKLNVSNKVNKVNGSAGIQIIEAQPLPITELAAGVASSQQTKHIIKESAGFMDALSSIPLTPKIKKKKKIEKAPAEKPASKPEKSASELDKMDFDSGIDEVSTPLLVTRRLSSSDRNNSMESESSECEFLSFDTPTPYDPDRRPTKGILQLLARGNGRRITWPEDVKLEKVKYFESDENERCNVSRPIGSTNFAEHRKEEIEKERDAFKNKNKNTLKTINNPGTTFIPYRLHLIDFEGVERLLVNVQSEECRIQAERLRNVLEDINLLYSRPDPRDPEPEMNIELLMDTETKEIPLEDENNVVADYSHTPFKVVANDPSSSVVYAATPVMDAHLYGNMNGLMNGPVIGNQMTNYLMNPSQFNNVNYGQMMSNAPNLYANQQPAYSSSMYGAMPMVQPPMQPMQVDPHWTTSNWNNVTNNQQQSNPNGNYHSNNHNGNSHNNKSNNHSNKKGKKVACRYYLKPGGCSKGSHCPFLHGK